MVQLQCPRSRSVRRPTERTSHGVLPELSGAGPRHLVPQHRDAGHILRDSVRDLYDPDHVDRNNVGDQLETGFPWLHSKCTDVPRTTTAPTTSTEITTETATTTSTSIVNEFRKRGAGPTCQLYPSNCINLATDCLDLTEANLLRRPASALDEYCRCLGIAATTVTVEASTATGSTSTTTETTVETDVVSETSTLTEVDLTVTTQTTTLTNVGFHPTHHLPPTLLLPMKRLTDFCLLDGYHHINGSRPLDSGFVDAGSYHIDYA